MIVFPHQLNASPERKTSVDQPPNYNNIATTPAAPVVGAADLVDGERGLVHAVLRMGELGHFRAAAAQHGLTHIFQAQTYAPVIFNHGAGTLNQGVH